MAIVSSADVTQDNVLLIDGAGSTSEILTVPDRTCRYPSRKPTSRVGFARPHEAKAQVFLVAARVELLRLSLTPPSAGRAACRLAAWGLAGDQTSTQRCSEPLAPSSVRARFAGPNRVLREPLGARGRRGASRALNMALVGTDWPRHSTECWAVPEHIAWRLVQVERNPERAEQVTDAHVRYA